MFIPIFYTTTVVLSLLHILISKKAVNLHRVAEVFLLYFMVIMIGFGGLYAFLGHALMPDKIAEYIGWPAGNPFQFEIAMTNLGIGITGILCIWFRGKFWLATIVMATIFLWGAAYGHIYQIIVHHNYHPGNSGPILYADIITPALTIFLGILFRLTKSQRR